MSDISCISDILNELSTSEYRSYSDEECKKAFDILPIHIKGIAYQWGYSDSVFRDDAYVYLKGIGYNQ